MTDTQAVQQNAIQSKFHVGRWCPARQSMEVDAQVRRALRGGTTAMRSMGTVFLPRDTREVLKPDDYRRRLNRTFLEDGYDGSVSNIAARPFQRPVTLTNAETLPEALRKLEQDADRSGHSLTEVVGELFEAAVDGGVAHLLIDHPTALIEDEDEEGNPIVRGRTAQEDKLNDIRAYFTVVKADNLISWSWEKDDQERDVLAHAAIYEQRDVLGDGGDYVTVDRVRMWTRDAWAIFERDAVVKTGTSTDTISADVDLLQTAEQAGTQTPGSKDRPYKLVRSGEHPLGVVPIVSVVLNQYGSDPLQARPCLHTLMWKNIESWQVGSWRNSVLYFNGAPILKGAGVPKALVDQGLVIGAGSSVLSNDPNFSLEYVEAGGGSATSLKERHLEISVTMKELGLEPLLRTQGVTATQSVIDEKTTQSKAQRWVEKTEWVVWWAYRMANLWETQGDSDELPGGFELAIFRDFTLGARVESELRAIDAARARKDLSRQTYIGEYVERGVLLTVDDPAEEIERIEEEGPGSGGFPFPGAQPFGQQNDDDREEDDEDDEEEEDRDEDEDQQ